MAEISRKNTVENFGAKVSTRGIKQKGSTCKYVEKREKIEVILRAHCRTIERVFEVDKVSRFVLGNRQTFTFLDVSFFEQPVAFKVLDCHF